MEFIEAYGLILVVGLAVALGCGLLYLVVRSAIWAYHDAEERGTPGWAVATLVVACKWPLSLLLWLVFRPEIQHESTEHLHNAGNGH